MIFKLLTPTQILLNLSIDKIEIEAIDGFFTLLPKHIDFVSTLTNGILTYTVNNKSKYVACDYGVIVKKGNEVRVSTSFAVLSDNLEQLQKEIASTFKMMEQERKEINLSITRLELGLTKGLMSLSKGELHAGL